MNTLTQDNFRMFDPLDMAGASTRTVHVGSTLTVIHPEEAAVNDLMNVVEASGVLNFWNDPEEDGYDEQDGDAV